MYKCESEKNIFKIKFLSNSTISLKQFLLDLFNCLFVKVLDCLKFVPFGETESAREVNSQTSFLSIRDLNLPLIRDLVFLSQKIQTKCVVISCKNYNYLQIVVHVRD